ncbi:MAG TPA: heparan-alpha-glucosaminide N-acetyltransferase domain-containing protein [Anaerolineales bacterium]|nr:heparan-alpha-glucosaminide N-acetyltransferase domain-containing protein [Anaerolineales bacterium]
MTTKRILSIDQFRGFAILTMVLANYMGGVKLIPAWLKHAPDVGLTVIDLIAPFFIFAIGLTFGLSFHRRLERDGALKTYTYFLTRYLAIIGLGAIISAGETAIGENTTGVDWGVLQAIGMAGLAALVVIRLPSLYRWLIGAGILVVYQTVLDRFLLDFTIRSPHGGLYGSLDWAAMLILGTALADLFHSEGRGRKAFPWVSGLILALGVALAFVSPVSKHRVSAAYVLITLGVSALLFLAFHLAERFDWQGRFLVVWGKNPLTLYFLHYLLIGLVFVPGIPAIYQDAPLWLVLIEMVALVGGISAVAYWMDRKNVVISL